MICVILHSKYGLIPQRYINTQIVIVNYSGAQENRHMAGVYTS